MEDINKYRWTRRNLLSYNAFLNAAIGARSIGKSYQGKDWAVSKFIKNGEKTKWIMRYQTELDKAIHEADFLAGIVEKYALQNYQMYAADDGCYIRYFDGSQDDKSVKWDKFISFSTMSERSIKAAEDRKCTLIIYDEFIPLPGTPLIKDEVVRFLEYVFTVFRERSNGKILMLSNNVTPVSPYFSYFHVHLPEKGKIYFDQKRGIAIENCKNEAFAEIMKKTPFGRLVSGTDYEKYAIDNDSMTDLKTFVCERPVNARPMVKIVTENGNLYLYIAPPGSLHISMEGPPTLPAWAADQKSHNEKTKYIAFAGSLAKSLIKRHFENATLFFDNDKAKAVFMASCAYLIK